MGMFRKKPVVIEAQMWDGTVESANEIVTWIEANGGEAKWSETMDEYLAESVILLVIVTLEGYMQASAGDWIIRGVQGEFYPCRSDIFNETYEPADG